jgi:hypothetical protein
MNWLKAIGSFFKGLFSKQTADAILAGVRKASPYIATALQLAGVVASIVGGPAGRTVAAVLAAAAQLGVESLLKPDATDAELGTAMRDIVVAALRKRFPNATTAQLNLAVELAVNALKAK